MMMSRSLGLALGMMLTLWLLVAPSAQAAREKPPSRLIEDILKQRPWPIVQVYGVAPGNATGSISSGDWQRAMRGMIADYQKEIPDLVSPYHFLNGNFHLLALDASPELLARAEERLESLRRASLEKLGYYPAQRHLHVSGNASSSGSGAIVDVRGFVLTAAHVIARFQQFNAPYVVACYAPVERMRADTGLAHSHPEGARQGVGRGRI